MGVILKNKKLKAKIKKFKKYTIGIIKKVKDILLKINDDEKKNSGDFCVNSVRELNYENGRYIGNVNNGLREGKGIMNYNDGDRYEGDWKNGIKDGKGIYYCNNGTKKEGEWQDNKLVKEI